MHTFLVSFLILLSAITTFAQCHGGIYDCVNNNQLDAGQVIPVNHPKTINKGGFYLDFDIYLPACVSHYTGRIRLIMFDPSSFGSGKAKTIDTVYETISSGETVHIKDIFVPDSLYRYGVAYNDSNTFAYDAYLIDKCPDVELDHSLDFVNVYIVTGLDKSEAEGSPIRLFPTSTNGRINMQGIEKTDVISITNSAGYTSYISSSEQTDLAGFENGMYIFRIFGKDKKLKLSQKVIKY